LSNPATVKRHYPGCSSGLTLIPYPSCGNNMVTSR
jgi:hypothetical protein